MALAGFKDTIFYFPTLPAGRMMLLKNKKYICYKNDFAYFCLLNMSLYSVFSTIYKNNSRVKVTSLAIILLILTSCGTGKTVVSDNKTSTTLQDDIIQYGRQYLGKPYRYAGKGPNTFDCSGYTSFVFKKFGYRLGSSSSGQDRQVPSITRREELRKGDLVFFEGNRKNGNVGHVGIVTETSTNGQFKFIHASITSGVIISSSTEPYYASRYLRGGRVLEENASYVTQQKPSSSNKQQISYPTSKTKAQNYRDIPEINPAKEGKTTNAIVTAQQTESHSGNGDDPIILVQTNSVKNQPIDPVPKGKENKDTLRQAKREMVLREEEVMIISSPTRSHTVQMGETLYSISRQYGCTVDQLKEWNPQLGAVLKAGERLDIFK